MVQNTANSEKAGAETSLVYNNNNQCSVVGGIETSLLSQAEFPFLAKAGF